MPPDYALGAHVAPLGLAFFEGTSHRKTSCEGQSRAGTSLPARHAGGAFIGLHGSWNRRPRSGYKVVFVPFADGRPAGEPRDVLTGFIGPDDKARGRPVGVAFAGDGSLLVADDTGNKIWRVAPAGG